MRNIKKMLANINKTHYNGAPAKPADYEATRRRNEHEAAEHQAEVRRIAAQERMNRLMASSDVALDGRTFDTLTNCPEWQQRQVDRAMKYALRIEKPDRSRVYLNLLLCGEYGTGKTHIAAAILNHCRSRGLVVLARQWEPVLNALWSRGSHRNRSGELESEANRMRDLLIEADVLVLDEVAASETDMTEQMTKSLGWVIRTRSNQKKATIITTNHDFATFSEVANEYVMNGLRESGSEGIEKGKSGLLALGFTPDKSHNMRPEPDYFE